MSEASEPSSPLQVSASQLDSRSSPGVEVVETHVSELVFVGDRVHKRKKPVRFAFVDLSTAAARERVCRREVELNRRFSPDVYLGVEDVVDDDGRVIDHAVLMRRMPAARRLTSLIANGDDVSACLRQVARIIARCHADGPGDRRIAVVATTAALSGLWQANLRELSDFVPAVFDGDRLDEIGRLADRYLAGREKLINARIERGLIVDGHGDLLVDDIFCLDDGPRILDCLEFDDRLRWGDVLYDVGFLAMDLERVGRGDLARAFVDWYAEYSAEAHPRSLEHHYIAYRALVRAKVSCLMARPDRLVEANAFLAQCQRHLRAGRVRVIVVGGLPGTGKTTVARGIGRRFGCAVVSTDELRKQEAGLDVHDDAAVEYGTGLYTPDSVEGTYQRMFDHARVLLDHGESVVLDASFAQSGWRAAAAALAEDSRADIVELLCELPNEVAADRLRERARARHDASDADLAIAVAMARSFASWPTAITVDTSPSSDVTLFRVVHALDGAEPSPLQPDTEER